jgi:ABC-type nitrate/sulfonate/bicarbonate transport system substrate-binding protein
MYVLAMLNTQGNGIAISKALRGRGLHLRMKDPNVIKNFSRTNGRKFRVAYTFPGGNQELWIRYWLAANGIDPDREVERLTIPPAETVQGMKTGIVDAFIAKHTKVDMIWVAGRSPTLVSQNLKATTLTYLAIARVTPGPIASWRMTPVSWGR